MRVKNKFGGSLRRKKKKTSVSKAILNYLKRCGKGLYLKPYKKTGGGRVRRKKNNGEGNNR